MTTLISFIGTGKREPGVTQGYQKTDYDFGDGRIISSSCFADAIRQSGKWTCDEVLFVGTETSSWSMLLENFPGLEGDKFLLWETLANGEERRQPLTQDSPRTGELRQVLSELWGIPARLLLHSENITPENQEAIFEKYIGEIMASGNDLVLDITHSFRWMPLLLTSALQFKNAFEDRHGDVKVVYGELRGKVSPVRELPILWKRSRTADAIALFFRKFAPEELYNELKELWPKGAETVRRIGTDLQGNFFLPLLVDTNDIREFGVPLKQLKNALAEFREIPDPPCWLREVREQLASLYSALARENPFDRLITLSQLQAERNLYAQAIISLSLAAESLAVQRSSKGKWPEFEQMQEAKKRFRKEFAEAKAGKVLDSVGLLRNEIAHGGIPEDRTRMTQALNIPGNYWNCLRAVQALGKVCLGTPKEA